MTKLAIGIDLHRCIGCNTCALACKMQNNVPDGMLWNRVLTEGGNAPDTAGGTWDNPEMQHWPVACQHCENPACVKVCPVGATYKDPETGVVRQDYDKCIGCRMCERACPYGAPKFNASGETNYFGGKTPLAIRELEPWQRHAAGRAEHCTLCTHRTSQGRPPACVEACGIGAMTWVDFDAPAPEAEKLIAAAKPMNAAAGTEPKIRYVGRHLDAAAMSPRV